MSTRAMVVLGFLLSTGCGGGALSRGEALDAVVESSIDAQAAALTSSTIEITTSITLGQRVEEAAQELRDFYAHTLPCAEVTLADATLTVDFGALSDGCRWRGQPVAGRHEVTLDRSQEDGAQVRHVWTDLSNGRVQVSGTATVTWSRSDVSRRVVHELSWTRLIDGRTGTSTGDRTQRPLPGGVSEGIRVDGTRSWTGARGEWNLDIDAVELRWADPVPSAGNYVLEGPRGVVTMTFSRQDPEDPIRVDVQTGRRDYVFLVRNGGEVGEAS